MNRRLSSACLLICCAAGAAWAQDTSNNVEVREGYEVITPQEFKRLPAGTPDGKKFTIHYVKFNKLFNEDLKLHGGERRGRSIPLLPGLVKVEKTRLRQPLIKNLISNKDSDGKTLVPKKSNVQLFGIGKRTSRGYTLYVNRVHQLDDFKEHFTELYAALPEGDANARLALIKAIRRAVRSFKDDRTALASLVGVLRKEARAAEFNELPELPAGLKDHIKFAKKHEDIELLDAAWRHSGISDAERAEVTRVLEEDLQAGLLLGKWYPYGEFKRKLGFEEDEEGGWAPVGKAELVAASEVERKRRKNLELKPQVDVGLLDVAAKKGDVIAGMDKGRVIAAKRGYPVSVIRVRERYKEQTLLWTQWVMADGTKVYFLNGFAFKKEEAE